jgi:hypothetical protein
MSDARPSPDLPANTFCGRTRREFMWQAGGAFTSVALTGMLASEGFIRRQALAFDGTTPLPPRRHLRLQARALQVRRQDHQGEDQGSWR